MRLFVALNFPEELRATLYSTAAPLRLAAPAARWTAADRIHLTLKFLGERSSALVGALAPALDSIAVHLAPIDVAIEGVGAFPNFRRPRVIWAGVVESPPMAALHREIDDACAALGVEREGRPFHPHVTLGRIGPRVPRVQVEALSREREHTAIRAVTTARTVDLMQSVGGRYVALHRAPLAG